MKSLDELSGRDRCAADDLADRAGLFPWRTRPRASTRNRHEMTRTSQSGHVARLHPGLAPARSEGLHARPAYSSTSERHGRIPRTWCVSPVERMSLADVLAGSRSTRAPTAPVSRTSISATGRSSYRTACNELAVVLDRRRLAERVLHEEAGAQTHQGMPLFFIASSTA